MLIGILSDTHNDVEMIKKALNVFHQRNVDMVIHAGDLISPDMISLFRDFNTRFVLGNEDTQVDELNRESEKMGFGCIDSMCSLEVDGKKIVVFHGTDVPLFRKAVASGEYDYIIKGHTHFFENYISNNTRVINPGALYRTDEFSVAILDTVNDRVELVRIEKI